MLPVERVIGEEGLELRGGRLALAVRLPWYRSLPLSTVEIAVLEIDGRTVDQGQVRFEYAGQSWPLAKIAELTDTFWFVMDSAWLLIPPDQVANQPEHEVTLRIAVYPPYIPGMRRENGQTERLAVKQEART